MFEHSANAPRLPVDTEQACLQAYTQGIGTLGGVADGQAGLMQLTPTDLLPSIVLLSPIVARLFV